MCGLEDIVDATKIASHLRSVYNYNLKENLTEHSNPQPTFALGSDGVYCFVPGRKKESSLYLLFTVMKCGRELNTRLPHI
ncbi:glycoside hydrolase family 116 protein [Niabella defluvii]|nr:glycoside hydrolase family 116 protein [Niabella sp. I65]